MEFFQALINLAAPRSERFNNETTRLPNYLVIVNVLQRFFDYFSVSAKINLLFSWLGYGMTELSPVCHVTPFDNIKFGSVGALLPNLECKVSQ